MKRRARRSQGTGDVEEVGRRLGVRVWVMGPHLKRAGPIQGPTTRAGVVGTFRGERSGGPRDQRLDPVACCASAVGAGKRRGGPPRTHDAPTKRAPRLHTSRLDGALFTAPSGRDSDPTLLTTFTFPSSVPLRSSHTHYLF